MVLNIKLLPKKKVGIHVGIAFMGLNYFPYKSLEPKGHGEQDKANSYELACAMRTTWEGLRTHFDFAQCDPSFS